MGVVSILCVNPLTAPPSLPLPCVLPPPAVHPDHHADHLHEPQCLGRAGHALHAQGVRHPVPPGAQRAEEEAQLQGGGHRGDHVLTPQHEAQRAAKRRGQDGAV